MKQSKRILSLTTGLVGLYAFFLVGGSVSQTTKPVGNSNFQNKASTNQDYCSRAADEFNNAENATPSDSRYFTNRAACRRETRVNLIDPDATEEEQNAIDASAVKEIIESDISAAIKADPKYARAYFERAKAKEILIPHKMADQASVLDDLDRAVELEPQNILFLAERADFLLFTVGYEDRFLEDASLLIKLEPKNSKHYSRRGGFFMHAQRVPEAIRDYSSALELDPDDYFTRDYRAYLYFQTKQYRAALDDLNYLLADKTAKSSSTHSLRAKVYRKLGKKTLAAADERKAKELSEEFQREFDNAKDRLKKLQQKSP